MADVVVVLVLIPEVIGFSIVVGVNSMISLSASFCTIVIIAFVGGLIGITSLVGFGNSATGISLVGGNIDLTGTVLGPITNFAFSMLSSGTITSLAAYFSITFTLSLVDTTVTLNAQLYQLTVRIILLG
ncbi:hypothetical protein WAG28_16250 [Bacillus cereus]|uniref:hypothetical protein n=1 Tax=Bacillus cereus TaxID=1396 RepID=UPI003012CF2A